MAETQWHDVIETITPYVVRIWTPQGSGTGFIISSSHKASLCAVATANHVINHAHHWEAPIRIEHQFSGKTLLLRATDRAINAQPNIDTTASVFERADLNLPDDVLPLTPKDKHFKPGMDRG